MPRPAANASPRTAESAQSRNRGLAVAGLALLLLLGVLIAIPFRCRQRWAWWAAWLPMIANLGYTFTFGVHDHTILARSLIADIALPVLLIAHIPAFFGPDRAARHQGRSPVTA